MTERKRYSNKSFERSRPSMAPRLVRNVETSNKFRLFNWDRYVTKGPASDVNLRERILSIAWISSASLWTLDEGKTIICQRGERGEGRWCDKWTRFTESRTSCFMREVSLFGFLCRVVLCIFDRRYFES